MQVLIHTCCAPCLISPLSKLKEEGKETTCYFFNPNIHPYPEFMNRLKAANSYCEAQEVPLIYETYDPVQYLRQVSQNLDKPIRCQLCYQIRMERTAAMAKARNFSAYTTTLLISPYQEHDFIRETGEKIAKKLGVAFYYRDWRKYYKEGVGRSKVLKMYRQKYCGCLFSEKERYIKS